MPETQINNANQTQSNILTLEWASVTLTSAPCLTSSSTLSWSPPLAAMCKVVSWQGEWENLKTINYHLLIQKLTSTYSHCFSCWVWNVICQYCYYFQACSYRQVCSNPPPHTHTHTHTHNLHSKRFYIQATLYILNGPTLVSYGSFLMNQQQKKPKNINWLLSI